MKQGEAYLWKQRAQVATDKVKELERLLSRAYPWLHNPYHGTTDYANEAEGDAVIEAVQTAIQHVPDEPDPLLKLPCGSCDGTGKIETGDQLLVCPNCTPQIVECGVDDVL
jgi:hypothetical protein